MPIKPENKKLYPKDWPDIRKRILERAKNRCELCSVENHAIGYRSDNGHFVPVDVAKYYEDSMFYEEAIKAFKIVLTVAHLDHDPANNEPNNLMALCQRCHNRHDAKHRASNAVKTRKAKRAWKGLFDE